MAKFYFTYGTDENFPFYGGWTEIIANDLDQAIELFKVVHPNRDGFLNCSDYYTEAEFVNTKMFEKDNRGHRCWEQITLTVWRIGGEQDV